MARIRTIKPAHWSDKELPKISLQAHLLWIATWNFSDDEGVFENDSLLLKSQIFPRRTDIRKEQIEQWIDQLVKARFVIPFTYNGAGYYIHRTFKTHQKIDKPQGSKIPKDVIRGVFDECSTNVQEPFSPVEYSTVEESNGEETMIEFSVFWDMYPNKVAKAKCEPKWKNLTNEIRKKIIETLPAFIAHKPFKDYNHPNPETYLNQKRWEDEIKAVNNNQNSMVF